MLTPGYKLDRYELLCPLAQGGMASVWLARLLGKHGFEKLVAIKTILPSFAADSRFRQMFLDEARIASRIEHTNVAQILDLGEQHDLLYLVMEWIEGDALSKLSRVIEKSGQQIPFGILLRILAAACAGLHAAHELCDAAGNSLGVVHRDVSPQNILVNSNGVVKIIDFGVAKARDRHAEETSSGILKGKIQYMAPEQAMGQPIDRRADVWAVGAILYRMLSGKPPFEGENQLATLHLLSSGRPPAELPPSVPKPIAVIVRRALTHDPSGRFATAAEMGTSIETAMRMTRCVAEPSDVAAYMAAHLSERTLARKEALALALKSAAERSRIAKVLQTNSESNSNSETLSREGRLASALNLDQPPAGVLPRGQLSTLDPMGPDPEASAGTLATASLDGSPASRATPRISRARMAIAVAAVALTVGAVILRPRSSEVTETKPVQAGAADSTVPIRPLEPFVKEVVDEERGGEIGALPTASAPLAPPLAAVPARPRQAPKSVVRRPKTESPAVVPRKRKIDDGF
jgi:serine/threonine protein kinase